ncbi:MAG: hypothetical protein KJZ53_08750 [Anaerolineales bacterium]|nr:hypothetical protein [Anaerolineales bacterium]
MSGEIKNNPKYQKLLSQLIDAQSFKPLLSLLRLLGLDVKVLEEQLLEMNRLKGEVERLASLPDRFNNLFLSHGWLLFEAFEVSAAEKAIEICETQGISAADDFLASYLSPEWVKKHFVYLTHIEGFSQRVTLAEKALIDYEEQRYYATALVVLTLIDGWVNELNIVDYQRLSFFSDKTNLVAWDSVVAHESGLPKLKKLLSSPRLKTRTEEIRIPYRNGIMHGMDLGYDNKYVAAKAWATLFAVREWAIKVRDGQLTPPPEPAAAKRKTFWESIEDYKNTMSEIESSKRWKPTETDYSHLNLDQQVKLFKKNSPEYRLLEFLDAWKKRNYGHASSLFTKMLTISPGEARETLAPKQLHAARLLGIKYTTPFTSDVRAELRLTTGSTMETSNYEFRLVATDTLGGTILMPNSESYWGVATWRRV